MASEDKFRASMAVQMPVEMQVQAQDLSGTYLMDNHSDRVIKVTARRDGTYEIKEVTGSWPWTGKASLDGRDLSGTAAFNNSRSRMRVEGIVQDDGSIVVRYIFQADSSGNPSRRVDHHVWYPA